MRCGSSGTQRGEEKARCRSWVGEEAEPRKEGGSFGEGPTGKGESGGGLVGLKREEGSDKWEARLGLTCVCRCSNQNINLDNGVGMSDICPKRTTIC